MPIFASPPSSNSVRKPCPSRTGSSGSLGRLRRKSDDVLHVEVVAAVGTDRFVVKSADYLSYYQKKKHVSVSSYLIVPQ